MVQFTGVEGSIGMVTTASMVIVKASYFVNSKGKMSIMAGGSRGCTGSDGNDPF